MIDIVGVGYCNVDYLGIVPHHPQADEKIPILEFLKQGGGVTATAMAAAARLGGNVRLITKIGGDEFGAFCIDELKKEGVDVSKILIDSNNPSQFSFISVDKQSGKRTIFWTASDIRLAAEDIKKEDVVDAKVLHIDSHHPDAAYQAAIWAEEAGMPVVIDVGTYRAGSERLLEHTSHLIASALFAKQFTGCDDPAESARMMMTSSRKLSAVTLGEKGCVYATKDGIYHQPAFKVDVVDTTGAGDVFHGAFSFGLSKGWDIPKTITFASAVAAIKCTKLGGRSGIPTHEQAIEFLGWK